MRILLFSFALLLSNSLQSQLYFPPASGNTWDTISPSTLNWCPQKINELYTYLESTNTKSFMVLKDGKIVLEKYFGTYTADSLHVWNSASKTLVGFMTGIAQKEGYLNISDTTSDYLGTGWTSLTPAQEEKITIRHQLSMTTGMDDITNGDCTDPGCLTYIADAGTRWSYHNAPYTLLNTVISNATGQNFNSYISNKLGTPCGISGLFVTFGYNKVFISKTRPFARFGLLLLAEGSWNGTPILNDPVYFNQMTNSSQTINNSYGYLTWLNGKSNFMVPGLQFSFTGPLMPDAPADMYAALGKNGQIINVVPSQNLVLVRMGEGDNTTLVGTQYNDSIWVRMNDLVCTAGVDENDLFVGMSVYPNPSIGKITIYGFQSDDQIIITNSLGESIPFQQNGNQLMTDRKGMFFLTVIRSGVQKTTKIILE
jgi:CubicO group peptidase (beta-lactamase class C family)